MPLSVLISILAIGVFLWLMLRRDIALSMAPISSCSAVGLVLSTVLLAIAFCAGLLLPNPAIVQLEEVEDVLITCTSALLTFLMLMLLCKEASAIHALAGAVLGRWMQMGGDSSMLWQIPLAWIIAYLLVAVLAYLLYSFLHSGLYRVHLFRQMRVWGVLILVASILVAALSGINISPILSSINTTNFAQIVPATVAIVLLIVGGVFLIGKTMSYSDNYYDSNPASAFSTMLAVSFILALFTFPIFKSVPRLPLSPFLLMLSANYACRLQENGAQINSDSFFRFLAASLLCSVISAFQAYLGMIGVMVVLLIVLLLLLLKNTLNRSQNNQRQILHSEEMNESAHKINELHLRAMQQENTHLQNLLALRRSQILDDAEKITENQHFISELYNIVGTIEEAPESERTAQLRELRAKLRLRLNHSDGLDKFYAKAETLHKDFATRLQDKYPNLTPQERRLATLLRLEFSTKYIASILGISESSVEVERHRIRTKLGLARKDRLTDFIKNI